MDEQIGPGAGVNCSMSGCDHGTHVAGIAAGRGSTFSGVAKDAGIIAIQVFLRMDNSSSGQCQTYPCALTQISDQIQGLERVYELRNEFKIAAVNMSLGGGKSTTNCDGIYSSIKMAIDNLRSVGIPTVAASGNDGFPDGISFPACISTAVSVGATTKSDLVAPYSNSASFLSLLAPGDNIYSSVPGGMYDYKSGTSMAAPHVAGAWAILKQKAPTATVTEVLSALQSTGVPVTDSRNNLTKPRIQVDAALNAVGPNQGTGWTAIDPPYIGSASSCWLTGVHFTSFSEGWAVGADFTSKRGFCSIT